MNDWNNSPQLHVWFEQRGEKILDVRAVSGGEICQSAQVITQRARYFAKWQDEKNQFLPQMFPTEAQSLRALGAANALRVPQVLAATSEFLVLEWIESARLGNHALLGAQLALQHRKSAAQFGFESDNYLGRWQQPNQPRATWSEFLRDNRLQPLLKLALELELLPSHLIARLKGIIDNVPRYLHDLESVPSLLHGDLWSGNFLFDASGQPFVFDACVYYGEREIEIAYCELFGGFDAEFYRAYNQEWPLQSGSEKRRALHQLVHLLNHLNHFGRAYLARVEAVCNLLDEN